MRAANLQRLTEQLKGWYPGIVVGGVGDRAHQEAPSDHNEDDTPGSKPAQNDADSKPEHRAIDLMIGSAFTGSMAEVFVREILNDAANKRRIWYVIWRTTIWSSTRDFAPFPYAGKTHNDHVHISTHAEDDDNTADWNLWGSSEGVDMDLNGKDIVSGITNREVFHDIWVWAATARGLDGNSAAGYREDDRFAVATAQSLVKARFTRVEELIGDLEQSPVAGVTPERLKEIVVEALESVLGRVKIV